MSFVRSGNMPSDFASASMTSCLRRSVTVIPLRFPLGAFFVDLGSGIRFLGLAAALAIGLLGGLVPAMRAVRTPPPDALGGEL